MSPWWNLCNSARPRGWRLGSLWCVSRPSREFLPAAILLLVTAACGNVNPNVRARPTRAPEHRVRAPAVVLEPLARLPQPTTAGATGPGLAVLREPRNREAVREAVRRFFRAVVEEDWQALQNLIDPDAQVTVDARGTRWQALTFWRLRLRKLDYTKLSGHVVFQDSAIETYSSEDLSALDNSRTFPFVIEPQEVLVQVPIETRSVDGVKLLGEEISFLFAPVDPGYSIVQMIEPFDLP